MAFQPDCRPRVPASNDPDTTLSRLSSVTITHPFYTRDNGLCTDFTVQPTPSTQALMTRFGMRLRPERTGFGIYLPRSRRGALLAWLFTASDPKTAPSACWERLTFLLSLDNPLFIGITDLPLDITTSTRNLYVSNMRSHRAGDGVILGPGAAVQGDSLLPLVGREVRVDLPSNAVRVVVTDISGAIVLPADGTTIAVYPAGPDGDKYAKIDLGALPHGRYTIVGFDRNGVAIKDCSHPVLHTGGQPGTLVLLDLLLTQPTLHSSGVFPVGSAFHGGPVGFEDVGYRLPFAARRTTWRYFVVNQSAGSTLRDIRIHSAGIRFAREGEVRLPTGATALVFRGETQLALSQQFPLDVRLTGWRCGADGHDNPLYIARLPVAASTPVWPAAQGSSGVSEIFVYL